MAEPQISWSICIDLVVTFQQHQLLDSKEDTLSSFRVGRRLKKDANFCKNSHG